MVDFKLENFSFSFPNGTSALKNINLEINRGELVVVCGRSGSGKTTLLRLLKPQLKPHGKQSGSLSIFQKDESEISLRDSASLIGFVMQNPELQCVTDTVQSELCFGLENLGFDRKAAQLRVAETAALFSLENLLDKKTAELSGGQKQFVNLASIVAMNPNVLLLDEPTAQLDPVSAQRLIDLVCMLCREYGVTVIISEHRLEKLVAVADRLVVLENGKIINNSAPRDVSYEVMKMNELVRLSLPFYMRLNYELGLFEKMPTDMKSGRALVSNILKSATAVEPFLSPESEKAELAVNIKNLYYSYDAKNYVLKGLDLQIKKGSFFAILGSNGAGKTTLLNLIGGLLKSKRGKLELFSKSISKYSTSELYNENVAFLQQNCESIFAGPTVQEDFENILRSSEYTRSQIEERIKSVSSFFEIKELLLSHPYDLSGGELQRCALAAVMLKNARLLLLDEPTKGLDVLFKNQLATQLRRLCSAGTTVVIVSHDTEFCAKYCDECALIFDGRAVSQGVTHEFFSNNCFYTTAASKLMRGIVDNVVTEEEVIELCKKSING